MPALWLPFDPFSPGAILDGDPGDKIAAKQAQAASIRDFLTRLATDDALLLRYVKGPVGVLQDELDAGRLTLEDIALLLAGNCCELHELMREGASPMDASVKWPQIWNFHF